MTFSKIEAGMMTLHKLDVEVEEFINENVAIFQVSVASLLNFVMSSQPKP